MPVQTLSVPGGADLSDFGRSLRLVDGRLYVAAPLVQGDAYLDGALFVYALEQGQWTLAETVQPPVLGLGERFGVDFAVDGDWLAVGTLGVQGDLSPRVFVYRRTADDSWDYRYAINGFDSAPQAMQLELRMRDNRTQADLFVGQPSADKSPEVVKSGMLRHYLLTSLGAFGSPALQPAELGAFDWFGSNMVFDGQQLLVSAAGFGAGSSDGRVYVYDVTQTAIGASFAQRQVLSSGQPGDGAFFGSSLDVDGGRLAIGASYADSGANEAVGRVHVYARNLLGFWIPDEVLTPAEEDWALLVGFDVAIDGEHVLAGAPKSGGELVGFTDQGGDALALTSPFLGAWRGWRSRCSARPCWWIRS